MFNRQNINVRPLNEELEDVGLDPDKVVGDIERNSGLPPLEEALKQIKHDGDKFKILRLYSSKGDADGSFPKSLVKLIGKGGGAALLERLPGKGYKVQKDVLVSKTASYPRYYMLALGAGGKPDGAPVALKPAQYKRAMSYS